VNESSSVETFQVVTSEWPHVYPVPPPYLLTGSPYPSETYVNPARNPAEPGTVLGSRQPLTACAGNLRAYLQYLAPSRAALLGLARCCVLFYCYHLVVRDLM
ncbi:hypothetical protein J6590_098137, partial [Homalodisca vitripennis]